MTEVCFSFNAKVIKEKSMLDVEQIFQKAVTSENVSSRNSSNEYSTLEGNIESADYIWDI